tara:strand:+ start:655 stop:1059 length:405 start_codon:yes stop_codon:yes gene_type:complete
MTFQKTVLTIAIVLLIICLIFIGVMMYNSKYSAKFPPVTSSCPDYWVDLGSTSENEDRSMCVPPGFIDPKTGKQVTPEIPGYGSNDGSCKQPKYIDNSGTMTSDELCDNSRWAKKCNLSWGGVTNNSDACGATV